MTWVSLLDRPTALPKGPTILLPGFTRRAAPRRLTHETTAKQHTRATQVLARLVALVHSDTHVSPSRQCL